MSALQTDRMADVVKNGYAASTLRDDGPSRLPLYTATTCLTLPLSRGTAKQHSLQSFDAVLCRPILGFNGYAEIGEQAYYDKRGLTVGIAFFFSVPFLIAGEWTSGLWILKLN